MIKGVIFDLDGVLIDSEIYHFNAFLDIMKNDNIDLDIEDFKKIIGISNDNTLSVISEYYGEKFNKDDFITKFNSIYKDESFNYNVLAFSYTKNVLEELRNLGYKLALSSSRSRIEIDIILKELDIEKLFDIIVTKEDCESSKPNPEIYLTTLEKMNLNSSECIVVEDSFYGIKAAKNAGMKVIAKKDRFFNNNQEAADFIFDNLSIIPTIIKMLNDFKLNFEIRVYEYSSSLYLKSLFLRNNCLRKAQGLNIFSEDLTHEKDYIFLGFIDDGQLIGSLGISEYESEDTARITSVVVDEDYQGKGIGKLLMICGENIAKSLNYSKSYLTARETKLGFYENLGYSVISERFILPPSNLPHFSMIKNF